MIDAPENAKDLVIVAAYVDYLASTWHGSIICNGNVLLVSTDVKFNLCHKM